VAQFGRRATVRLLSLIASGRRLSGGRSRGAEASFRMHSGRIELGRALVRVGPRRLPASCAKSSWAPVFGTPRGNLALGTACHPRRSTEYDVAPRRPGVAQRWRLGGVASLYHHHAWLYTTEPEVARNPFHGGKIALH